MKRRWLARAVPVSIRAPTPLMAVSVDLSDRVRHSGASELFAVGAYDADPFGNTVYDVAEDGRFLMTHVATGSRTWRWIQNWGVDLEATLAGAQ